MLVDGVDHFLRDSAYTIQITDVRQATLSHVLSPQHVQLLYDRVKTI